MGEETCTGRWASSPTPFHHFGGGKNDPAFRAKLEMASGLVEKATGRGIPFRAVVADSFYGENRRFKHFLEGLGLAHALLLKKSHSWWHAPGTIGAPWEAALLAGWERVVRRFRDGHREDWWALEVEAGPYGKKQARRALVVATDRPRCRTSPPGT